MFDPEIPVWWEWALSNYVSECTVDSFKDKAGLCFKLSNECERLACSFDHVVERQNKRSKVWVRARSYFIRKVEGPESD